MCCVIHSTFTKADVASLPKWCLLTNNTADYFQFDLDYPEVLETNCDTIYPLYVVLGLFLLTLTGTLCFYYHHVSIYAFLPARWMMYCQKHIAGRACSVNASDGHVVSSRDVESVYQMKSFHEIKIAPHKLTSDITYCTEEGKPVILGEGRYGFVYKAMYEENCVAVKCIEREDKAEHEKIMFDLIGSRSDNLLRLTAYVSKHCDPHNRPTSIILIPAYLQGDIGSFLKHLQQTKGGIDMALAVQLITTLACGIYELHRASEGIENPLPRIAHRDLKPANVLISDKYEAIICDFNSAVPLIRELPHQCECFNRSADARVSPQRPFEHQVLLQAAHHDRPGCLNRKILQQIDEVRDKCFEQKCPDGTWLYMAPEILSLKMFEVGEIDLTNGDIVNRYCSADIYSFSLIAWLVMSQCKQIYETPPIIESTIDDYLFDEFVSQSTSGVASRPARTVSEKERLMNILLNDESIRPRCTSHQMFELIQECWAMEGACRPDARQLYKKLKDIYS